MVLLLVADVVHHRISGRLVYGERAVARLPMKTPADPRAACAPRGWDNTNVLTPQVISVRMLR